MFKTKNKFLPWLVLVGIILIRGFASGLNGISGLFLTPVSEELQVGIGTLSLYFSVMSAVQVVWFSYAGRFLNKYDIRIGAAVAAVLQALTFAAFGLMSHVVGWYALAIPQAMGSAILVNLIGPILINRWFPNNTGIILGVQSACVGLFGAVLQPVTSNIIVGSGWRAAYLVIGLVAFVVIMAAVFIFLKDRPEKSEEASKEESTRVVNEELSTHSASFFALLIFMLSLTGVAVFVQHIPTYGNLLGYSVTQVGTALSLASLGTAVGALMIGFLADRIGAVKTCYVVIGLWFLAVIGFWFGGRSALIFAAAAFLNGVAIPSVTIISPVLTLAFYGKVHYERIYAKVSMGAPLSSIFLVPIYGFIYDATQSYVLVLVMLMVLLALAGGSIAYGWRCRKEN
ncbi:MAG: MFS transporter [Lachnospiraceae bacterium]|nr:MFS transporter [Lachnospiraceae bacterium]